MIRIIFSYFQLPVSKAMAKQKTVPLIALSTTKDIFTISVKLNNGVKAFIKSVFEGARFQKTSPERSDNLEIESKLWCTQKQRKSFCPSPKKLSDYVPN